MQRSSRLLRRELILARHEGAGVVERLGLAETVVALRAELATAVVAGAHFSEVLGAEARRREHSSHREDRQLTSTSGPSVDADVERVDVHHGSGEKS